MNPKRKAEEGGAHFEGLLTVPSGRSWVTTLFFVIKGIFFLIQHFASIYLRSVCGPLAKP